MLVLRFALAASVACASSAAQPAATATISSTSRVAGPTRAALAVVVLGSGGPRSFGRAASSYLVFVDGVARILVDVGPGAFLRLGELGVDFRNLDLILLTHLHIDHSGDLPGFAKSRDLTYGEALRFRVFGPGGGGEYPSTVAFVDRLFGPQGAFAYLPGFRNALQLDTVDLPIDPAAAPHEVVREPGLAITSIAVDHGDVPAVAFRVDHAGRAVVVSGDLASRNDNLAHLAAGADLLIYDTAVLDPPGSPPPLYELHTTPTRIGEVATQAAVKSLVLSHIPPAVDAAKGEVQHSVAAGYRGPNRFASDCMRIEL
jgi:ribonuclease BN (tRNA processing enzyme)